MLIEPLEDLEHRQQIIIPPGFEGFHVGISDCPVNVVGGRASARAELGPQGLQKMAGALRKVGSLAGTASVVLGWRQEQTRGDMWLHTDLLHGYLDFV